MDGTGETRDASTETGPLALLLAQFSSALDRKKPKAASALFVDNGVFQPAEEALVGRPAIEAFFEGRVADERRRTCHQWSNLILRPTEPGRAHFEAVLTNYVFEPAVSEGAVQMRIGNVWGVCVGHRPEGWQFESHFHERLYALALPLTAPPKALRKD